MYQQRNILSNLVTFKIKFSENNTAKCPNIGCSGIYCNNCFNELLGKCFLCHEPIDYNDVSDFSEEKGSADEGNLTNLRIDPVKTRTSRKKHTSKRKNKKSSKKTKKQKLV